MPDIADNAEKEQQPHLDHKLESRMRFTRWDGNPRECSECGEDIPDGRLNAINATECVDCTKI